MCSSSVRWAVSTVMTRQNRIPVKGGAPGSPAEGEATELALIPAWDMCNHRAGRHSTDYNVEQDR